MPTFKLTLAYDGTDFVGWQRQATGISIQGLLEQALSELEGRQVDVAGAGRTDAGVHALGQVASATLTRKIDARGVLAVVNARLPDAIRVMDAVEVPASFHARFQARTKCYRYRIWNAEIVSPFEQRFAWHVAAPALDVDALAAAAIALEGHHDFSAFQAASATPRSTERTVFSSRICRDDRAADHRAPLDSRDTRLITYEISGNGFLRHMVRSIVGTLVEVGRGRHPVEWVSEVLASKERARAGPTAPAEGLFLVRVEY